MTSPRYIVGAGLAGLLAAHAWPGATVLERSPHQAQAHQALLRFRTDAVARLTGCEFKKVRVHKGIWHHGAYVVPNITVANLYAHKCLGKFVGDRSIWNIDPVDRFIAPPDFYAQLLSNVGERVRWNTAMDWSERDPVVSTAPMPEVLRDCGMRGDDENLGFHRAPIHVLRFNVPGADLYQTVYFPEAHTRLYRASMTGSTLICEFAGGAPQEAMWCHMVDAAFGLDSCSWWDADTTGATQRYGKIAPIDDAERRGLLFALTHDHGIYSLGRFATWRNLLLDDVVDDIAVIKRLMRNGDAYELRRSA